jgi:chemotaxis protein MotB
VAKIINQLPNRISIYGPHQRQPRGAKADSDWSLSAEPARTPRGASCSGAGVDEDRIYQVSGKATSEPLYAGRSDPAGNRRIAIVLLREKPVLPPSPAL